MDGRRFARSRTSARAPSGTFRSTRVPPMGWISREADVVTWLSHAYPGRQQSPVPLRRHQMACSIACPMRPVLHRALLLAAVFALSPLDGVAGEKQIVDVKELARTWRGWVNEVPGDAWATMNV